MKKALSGKLTYANVISTVCLFLLLGGGAAFAATQLAKNSVGTKQLKNNAVTGAKVKDGSLTGSDIDSSSLGPVPSAGHANSAATASSADHARLAEEATKATDSTTLQGNPAAHFLAAGATAVDSGKLGGLAPSDYGSVESARFAATPLGTGTAMIFGPVSGVGATVGNTDQGAVTTLSPARATVARDLAVKLDVPVPVGTAVAASLVVNGSPTTFTCEVPVGQQACVSAAAIVVPAAAELSLLLREEAPTGPLPSLNVMTGFRLASN